MRTITPAIGVVLAVSSLMVFGACVQPPPEPRQTVRQPEPALIEQEAYVPKQPVVTFAINSEDTAAIKQLEEKLKDSGTAKTARVLAFPSNTAQAQRGNEGKVCGRVAVLFQTTDDISNIDFSKFKSELEANPNLGRILTVQPNTIGEGMIEFPNTPTWSYTAVTRGTSQPPATVSSDIRVAVIDTGLSQPYNFNVSNPKNYVYWSPASDPANTTFLPDPNSDFGKEFVEDDFRLVENGTLRFVGHGTAIASIIAARYSDANTPFGMAPGSTIIPIKACDRHGLCTSVSVALAICHAIKSGAQIINLSLGFPDDKDPTILDALQDAIEAKVLVVAAGGNYGRPSTSRQRCPEGNCRIIPAAASINGNLLRGVMAVGALERTGRLADFSSRGDFIDMVAPGQDILAFQAGLNVLGSIDGTSFSTAFVSGAAAQYLGQVGVGRYSPAELEAILSSSMDKCDGDRNSCGRGLIQIPHTEGLYRLGTNGDDWVEDSVVDSSGNTYVIGNTSGVFPGQASIGVRDININPYDMFVAKIDPFGYLLWLKQFGTEKMDYGYGVAVDTQGNVFTAGYTKGDFPGNPHLDRDKSDGFVAAFDSQGNSRWSKLISIRQGHDDLIHDIAVDANGEIVVAGATGFDLFRQEGPEVDGFVIKLSTIGTTRWQQVLASSRDAADQALNIAVAPNGNIYVAGKTLGTFNNTRSPRDLNVGAFLAQLDPQGNLSDLRHFGSDWSEQPYAIGVDANSNVYVAGVAGISSSTAHTIFAKFSPRLETLEAMNRLQVDTHDNLQSLAVGSNDQVFVAGFGYPGDFDNNPPQPPPPADPVPPTPSEAIIANFRGSVRLWCHIFPWVNGGFFGISVLPNGNLMAIGDSTRTLPGYQAIGGRDVVLMEFDSFRGNSRHGAENCR